jgi:hypothetical protein
MMLLQVHFCAGAIRLGFRRGNRANEPQDSLRHLRLPFTPAGVRHCGPGCSAHRPLGCASALQQGNLMAGKLDGRASTITYGMTASA